MTAASGGSDLDALRRAEAEVEKEFMAKEEVIRNALEEQERRFRLEEEARNAMDRAEREAREKADHEARELALAADRARREAEQRAREEGILRQQEDKEKRAKEQEERKKKSEEERKKRERERREQEQRAREEALARKRAEQEQLDRKKSERERLAKEAKKIAWGPGRITLVAVVVLIALVIGGIQVAPMSAYAPQMEKLASDAIGEPVHIGSVHASVFPGFHLKFDNVTIGMQQDVRVPSVTAYMDFGSLFADQKVITTLQIDQLQAKQEVLARLPRWLGSEEAQGRNLKVQKVVFKGTKVDVKGATLPPFDATVFMARGRKSDARYHRDGWWALRGRDTAQGRGGGCQPAGEGAHASLGARARAGRRPGQGRVEREPAPAQRNGFLPVWRSGQRPGRGELGSFLEPRGGVRLEAD